MKSVRRYLYVFALLPLAACGGQDNATVKLWNPNSLDRSAADDEAAKISVANHVATCMKREGFQYTPQYTLDHALSIYVNEANFPRSRNERASIGFGFSEMYERRRIFELKGPDPKLLKMADSAGDSFFTSREKCFKSGFEVENEILRAREKLDPALTALNQAVLNNSSVQKATANYVKCMASAGFKVQGSRELFYSKVFDDVEKIRGNAKSLAFEIPIALADFDCMKNLKPVLDSAAQPLYSKFYSENSGKISSIISLNQKSTRA